MKTRKLKKIVALAVVLTYLLSLGVVSPAAADTITKVSINFNVKFKDGDQAKWAFKNITELSAKQVIRGYNDGSFRPNAPVTRTEALVMVLKAAGYSEEVQQTVADTVYLPFTDGQLVPQWAKSFVDVAVKNGYLAEEQNQNFQPNKPATRAWVARLLVRALNLTDELQDKQEAELPFTDDAAINADYLPYIALALENGILQGYPNGTFQPNKPVTRAEMAALLGTADNELELEGDEGSKVVGTVVYIDLNTNAVIQETQPEVQISSSETVDAAVYDEDEEDEGTIVETIGTITVTSKKGENVSLPLAKDVQVFIQDQSAAISDVKAGNLVELALDNGAVKFIEVKPLVVRGQALAVDADVNTIKVQLRTGEDKVFQVSEQVQIKLNGKAAALSDIQEGAKVTLKLDGDKVTEIKANRVPSKHEAKQKVQEKAEDKIKEKVEEKTKEKGKIKVKNSQNEAEDESEIEVETEVEVEVEVEIEG